MNHATGARAPRLRPEITLEHLNGLNRGHLPGLLGLEFTELAPGRMAGRMPVRPDLLAGNGFLHAASVVALADTACGYATVAHLPEGAESFTTIELKSNFFGTVVTGVVLCEARAEHLGRNTQVWDAVVSDAASGRRLALFRCTQMVLWPKEA